VLSIIDDDDEVEVEQVYKRGMVMGMESRDLIIAREE